MRAFLLDNGRHPWRPFAMASEVVSTRFDLSAASIKEASVEAGLINVSAGHISRAKINYGTRSAVEKLEKLKNGKLNETSAASGSLHHYHGSLKIAVKLSW